MTPKVFVTGEALIDFVPVDSSLGSAFAPRCGGSTYNVAKAAALQGSHVEFVGPISTDMFGDRLAEDLRSNGVGLTHAQRVTNATTLAFVEFQKREARYAFFNAQTATQMADHSSTELQNEETDIIHAGSISLIDEPGATSIIDFVKKCARTSILSLDPNARPSMIIDLNVWRDRIETLIAFTGILKLSDEDLAVLRPGSSPEAFLKDVTAQGVSIAVVTLGAGGAIAATRTAMVREDGYTGKFEDTVGCGDTVTGTILAELLGKQRTEICAMSQEFLGQLLKRCMAAAWLNCQQSGCQPPRKDAITQFLAQSN